MADQPDITYIDQYIDEGKKAVMSLSNFYDTILVGDANNDEHIFKIAINDFFLKYRDQLEDSIQYYSVPESMFYKPKMLSLELYGTTELWLSLLRVNNMKSICEFHVPIIKVYNPGDLRELINIFFKRDNIIT